MDRLIIILFVAFAFVGIKHLISTKSQAEFAMAKLQGQALGYILVRVVIYSIVIFIASLIF